MAGWPAVTEPLLRERQGMSDEEFFEFLGGLLKRVGTRVLDDAQYEAAIGYPWERPPGSCFVTGDVVEELTDIEPGRREELVYKHVHESAGRVPLLTYGANGSPARLALKLAHLPDGDREALILAGKLEDFDVGVAAQPPLFLTMPATLIPSAGTTVRVAVLFLTPVQFTALWWTELSYRVGALAGITLNADAIEDPLDHVICFISRYGAFCVDGVAVAQAAIAATNRRAQTLTQVEILDAAARTSMGEGYVARDLIEVAYGDPATFMARHFPSFQAASQPFESEHWTEMPVGAIQRSDAEER
jgi:hypothetical protein